MEIAVKDNPVFLVHRSNKSENELYHYGVLGMKWGVRRFQNKDGSLTAKGRARIGLDKYENEHNEDIVLKKGTKGTRLVSTDRYEEYLKPEYGGSEKEGKKYLDSIKKSESDLDQKYLSVDGVRNSGRLNGTDFYTSWFTDEGYEPLKAYMDTYTLKKDVKVASGKKVVDELLKEVGSYTVTDLIKSQKSYRTLTLEYTRNKDLFNKINKRFKELGYDAIEDINDSDTDMPVIFLDSKRTLGNPTSTKTGKEALDDLYEKYKRNI